MMVFATLAIHLVASAGLPGCQQSAAPNVCGQETPTTRKWCWYWISAIVHRMKVKRKEGIGIGISHAPRRKKPVDATRVNGFWRLCGR